MNFRRRFYRFGLLTGLLFLLSGILQAQPLKLSLSIAEGTVFDLIEAIESQSDYHFTYQARELEMAIPEISINEQDLPLEGLIARLKAAYPVDFLVQGNNVAITVLEAPNPSYGTISGSILDAKTGDILIGATLYSPELQIGTISSTSGYYSLTLPEGRYNLLVQYLGYETRSLQIDLYGNLHKKVLLSPNRQDLDEVIVTHHESLNDFTRFNLSSNIVHLQNIRSYPSILSEKDVLLSIDFMPGISLNPENINGLIIRGSSDGEILTTLDKVPVYSISHSVSNLSIFNPDIVNHLTINKGGVPIQHGNKAGSAIEVITRKGNENKTEINGAISNISSRLSVEGPIFKEKLSYLFSARRGGKNFFQKSFFSPNNAHIYFYDINSKISYKINPKNDLVLSTYWGKDLSTFDIEDNHYARNQWNTNTFSLDWGRQIGSRIKYNMILFNSRYSYSFEQDSIWLAIDVYDTGLKNEFNFYIRPGSLLRFGVELSNHFFDNPIEYKRTNTLLEYKYKFNSSLEGAAYLQHERQIGKRFKIKTGGRLTAFRQFLNGNFYESYYPDMDSSQFFIDSTALKIYDFGAISPVFQLNYRLSKTASLKLGVNRSSQFIHQLSSINAEGFIYKILVPSGRGIKPLALTQFSAAYMKTSLDGRYDFSLEGYYKHAKNSIEYRDSVVSIDNNTPFRNYVRQGEGLACGLEFMVRKKEGRLQGILSYALSKSVKTIDGINQGRSFYSAQHQPHDFALNLNYRLNPSLKIAVNFILQSGRRYTLQKGNTRYERNRQKFPNYHRADIGIQYEKTHEKRFKSTWELSIFNVYNRKNAYFLFRNDRTGSNTEYLFYSLYGITPTLSWSFHFAGS